MSLQLEQTGKAAANNQHWFLLTMMTIFPFSSKFNQTLTMEVTDQKTLYKSVCFVEVVKAEGLVGSDHPGAPLGSAQYFALT